MLEIILLIFLSRRIGQIAASKGQAVWKWRLATILAWIGCEIPVMTGSLLYTRSLIIASLSGILAGLLGYFIVRRQVERLPEVPADNS